MYGVIGVHPFQLALFDDRAQAEVWGEDDGTLISSSYQPAAKIEHADGGFTVSGHWSFSSGCGHCEWVLLGGVIPADVSETGVPEMRTFLLPRKDYRIVENWEVLGLKATGSNDIIVDKVFVPDYRTHKLVDGFLCQSPGNKVNSGPLYRIPWAQIFVRSVSTSAIGATRGALDDYIEIAKKRIPSFAEKGTVYDPVAQSLVAEVETEIHKLQRTLLHNMNLLYTAVEEEKPNSIEERVQFRYESAVVVDKCAELVTRLQHNLGGRGIYLSSPVIRRFLDIHAARAHVANGPDKYAYNLGAVRLGLENQDYFI
jgi:3-hydroxy-9,10-secoandrosta-1,3,5(10)-triene-9,17-dione monooxygenase